MFDFNVILNSDTVRWYSELSDREKSIQTDAEIDPFMERFAVETGADRCPVVLNALEFDAFSSPFPTLLRGHSEEQYVESFISGKYRPSIGLYGQGIYTLASEDEPWAMENAARFGRHVVKIRLHPESIVMPLTELENHMDRMPSQLTNSIATLISSAVTGDGDAISQKVLAAEELMRRVGFLGLAMGVDAYFIQHDAKGGVGMDYYIVLNRAATVVRRENFR